MSEAAGLDENPFDKIIPNIGKIESRCEFTESQVQAVFAGLTNGFFYKTE